MGGGKRVIFFADHARCDNAKKVEKFIREHSVLKKMLPKCAPNLDSAKRLVNKPLKSVMCTKPLLLKDRLRDQGRAQISHKL
jgi:hypothetical protein